MVNTDASYEHWINKRWRPTLGWSYIIITLADFILFPILWGVVQTFNGQPITQWDPLTMRMSGLFHVTMGGTLCVTAYGRTKEKLAGVHAEKVKDDANKAG